MKLLYFYLSSLLWCAGCRNMEPFICGAEDVTYVYGDQSHSVSVIERKRRLEFFLVNNGWELEKKSNVAGERTACGKTIFKDVDVLIAIHYQQSNAFISVYYKSKKSSDNTSHKKVSNYTDELIKCISAVLDSP